MKESNINRMIHEYIVSLYLLKAMDFDKKVIEFMKLNRFWNTFLDRLHKVVLHDHIRIKKRIKQIGCKIMIEEVLNNKNVHVMYVFEGYEHHCEIMPAVLKSKCEEKLDALMIK
ncbi:hypothetical protein [Chengkuizengella marina]|uniref:Uncharacterized protein n=1 Tax=Chengkuizengella marina TaxID=2507566 RepID=A0A6N9Q114_9BACL|nr:hypothetical protein [Chengkuizengella marina]NBI29027.1 hypothetical protein [Chengkuizengella marina]